MCCSDKRAEAERLGTDHVGMERDARAGMERDARAGMKQAMGLPGQFGFILSTIPAAEQQRTGA